MQMGEIPPGELSYALLRELHGGGAEHMSPSRRVPIPSRAQADKRVGPISLSVLRHQAKAGVSSFLVAYGYGTRSVLRQSSCHIPRGIHGRSRRVCCEPELQRNA